MKAVILVGGEGTRLRPLTYSTVKAMVPVLNQPFIEHMIRYLDIHSVDETILAMGYQPDTIKRYIDGTPLKSKVTYSIENSPLGTAGAVRYAESHLKDESAFFILNGDIFTDLNLTKMFDYHKMTGAKITIGLTPVDDPTQFGVVEQDARQKIIRFIEKPRKEEAPGNLINAGVYIIEHEVLDLIPKKGYCMFERELFPELLSRGFPVYGFSSGAYWMDMGTPGKYFRLNTDILNNRCSLLPHKPDKNTVASHSIVHKSSILTAPVVVGEGCMLSKDTNLVGPCIIGKGCKIDENTHIENSIFWQSVTIGKNAVIKNCIMTSDCLIEDCTYIENSISYRNMNGDQLTMHNWYSN
jgi:mannose-1-phosphate guanylyltransferase